MDIKKYAVVSDFDGTITINDSKFCEAHSLKYEKFDNFFDIAKYLI